MVALLTGPCQKILQINLIITRVIYISMSFSMDYSRTLKPLSHRYFYYNKLRLIKTLYALQVINKDYVVYRFSQE